MEMFENGTFFFLNYRNIHVLPHHPLPNIIKHLTLSLGVLQSTGHTVLRKLTTNIKIIEFVKAFCQILHTGCPNFTKFSTFY